jgi:hypothetical protein
MTVHLKIRNLRFEVRCATTTMMLAAVTAIAFSTPNIAIAQDGAAGALLEEIVTTAR